MRKDIFFLFILVLALFDFGCGNRAPFVAIPAVPPAPSTSGTAVAVDRAASHVETATANVDVATVHAKAGDADKAVAPLASAKVELTGAADDLSSAKQEVVLLTKKISEQEKAHGEAERAMKADFDGKLEDATRKFNVAAGENLKLKKQVDDLQNEVTRDAQKRIGAVGALLILAGIGCVAGYFASQGAFKIGVTLAIICGATGSAALALAVLIPTIIRIVVAVEIAAGVVLVALLAWVGWHLFKHIPLPAAVKV